jgi:hypothetical protein
MGRSENVRSARHDPSISDRLRQPNTVDSPRLHGMLSASTKRGTTHMSDKPIENFEEFWPFYVGEHSKKTTRVLHFVGTTGAGITALAAIALKRPALIPLALVMGYGPAWFSHFFIENNRPASFRYPLWSFQADWVMWAKILTGTMDAEVERIMNAEHASNGQNGASAYDAHSDGHVTHAGTNDLN